MKTFKVPAMHGETGLCAHVPQPYVAMPLYSLFKRNGKAWERITFQCFTFEFAHKLYIDKLMRLDSDYKLIEVNDSPEANLRFNKNAGSNRPRFVTRDYPTFGQTH